MTDKQPGGTHEQRERHSLPGTRQAGKGPVTTGTGDPDTTPRDRRAPPATDLEAHSLPGTDQAGKDARGAQPLNSPPATTPSRRRRSTRR